jgi:hypothetical protein
MALWRAEHQNVYELNAWQQAVEFSTLLDDVCRKLDLDRDKEWLLFLLQQVGQRTSQVVETGWNQEYLAEFLLSISEALSLLALIDYYLVFLCHEGFLTGARAGEVIRQLSALQDELASLAGRLREASRARLEGAISAAPWSRN